MTQWVLLDSMAGMSASFAQLLLPLFLLPACTSVPPSEPVREVYFESPCVRVTWEGTPSTVNGVEFRRGPQEWSARKPGGIYVADSDACRGELLVIPYTLRSEEGAVQELFAVVQVAQPWFVGYARTQITAPLHYSRGLLALTADRQLNDSVQKFEFGVLKMGQQHPLALVDDEGEPYTRGELKPAAALHGPEYPGGYFQHRRKGAGEWDGLLLLKQDFGGDGCRWFNVVSVEQAAPGAMPVVTVLQGLQRRGKTLTDSSGRVHYVINRGALRTPSGRMFAEMQLDPVIPVVRSANAP